MTRYIGIAFKEHIKHSIFTYDSFAPNVGLAGKQGVNHWVNHKLDCDWKYDDIALWCEVLGVDFDGFMEDVNRQRANSKKRN